jgi:hypothetical protein
MTHSVHLSPPMQPVALLTTLVAEWLDDIDAVSLGTTDVYMYCHVLSRCRLRHPVRASRLLDIHRLRNPSLRLPLVLPSFYSLIVDRRDQLDRVRQLLDVREIIFSDDFDEELERSDIPSSILHLTFGRAFDRRLVEGLLPTGLIDLTFTDDSCFNQRLDPNVLPTSLCRLTFGEAFNQPITEASVLLSSLEQLFLGYNFNHPLTPRTLTHLLLLQGLNLGDSYDHPLAVGLLPTSLRSLFFNLHASFNSISVDDARAVVNGFTGLHGCVEAR